MKTISQQCELLMSYPIVHLFTSDTPSAKEKKAEKRCTDIVDSYYKIDNPVTMYIRNFLHELESSFKLGFNEVYLEEMFRLCGSLDVLYKHHYSKVKDSTKTEPILKEYYSGLKKLDFFGLVIEQSKPIAEEYSFEIDIKLCKEYFVVGKQKGEEILKGINNV